MVEAGPDGDRVVVEASGDPGFLGFAAGPYYPPAEERIDPLLLEQIQAPPADRPGAETWAYVMFARRITEARVAELESFGARVVGFHPHYALRVAVPANSVQSMPGAHSCASTVTMVWNPANDALSGVAGYALTWTHASNSDPGATIDTTGTSSSTNLAPSTSPWHFHVRAVDEAGDLGNVVHAGPYRIGQASAAPYCNGNPNSTGQVATLVAAGLICLASGDLTLRADDMPANQFGHYMMSESQAFVAFFGGSEGNLCLGPPIYRFSNYILNTGAGGQVDFPVPFQNLPQGLTIGFGETWNFQFWFRDKTTVLTSNTTNGLEVQFD